MMTWASRQDHDELVRLRKENRTLNGECVRLQQANHILLDRIRVMAETFQHAPTRGSNVPAWVHEGPTKFRPEGTLIYGKVPEEPQP